MGLWKTINDVRNAIEEIGAMGMTWGQSAKLTATPVAGTFDEDTGAMSVVARAGGTQYASAAVEACASVKATAGYIREGAVYNDGLAAAYLQFHDLAAAPAPGAVPAALLAEIPAGGTIPWPCIVQGGTGLQACLSSTAGTYTAYAHGHFLLWWD